ncbi:DUF3800 domain-containing protein [Streptomyces sp. NPDC051286]|uniref:DUF3800 domain-containing protein n=1 Tax=Streptomyces sp. NPDC051286 TaxID=3365647 RepID=UPI0037BC4A58
MSSSSATEPAVVYVDESANSGQNLLDPHQPVFTVAGVHLRDDLAGSIVDELRAQMPANQKEPKTVLSLALRAAGRPCCGPSRGCPREACGRTWWTSGS